MMFFTVLGWLMLVLFALGMTFAMPWVILMMSAFGGGRDGKKWAALIPLILGCLALYGLFTHAPFHIILS